MATIKKIITRFGSDPDILSILALATKQSKEFVMAHPEYNLNLWEKIKFWTIWRHRQKNIPLAYLKKHKEFFGLDFYVNKNVLIPRPETELMVEEILKIIKDTKQQINLFDIGTGSGCIPIAVGKNYQADNLKISAIDISRAALRVAKKNSKKHNVKIDFLHGDLLSPIKSSKFTPDSLIIISANLPYLTNKQFQMEPTIQKEPKLALISDDQTGLNIYQRLLEQIKTKLTNTTTSFFIFLEINPEQSVEIKKIINSFLPSTTIEIKKDLAARDRLVIIKRNF